MLSDEHDVVKAKIMQDFEYSAGVQQSSTLHVNKDVISSSAFGSLGSCMSACKYTPRTLNLSVVLDEGDKTAKVRSNIAISHNTHTGNELVFNEEGLSLNYLQPV